MNISLLNIIHNKVWDFRPDMAQSYADALKSAISLHLPNDIEKQEGYFLSKKGVQKDGKTIGANFEDKLYVDNIYRVENHLYWNDEELQDDDQIINVVVIDGPVTRDGDACSYGTKDFRDQVMYANTIPQVVGHLFVINTPGGQSSCRNDYEMMIADCREKGKPTVAFVDGMCCSSGVNLASRCDRTIVMNAKDEFGCIGSMAAFWAVAHDTVDQDGYRYVELVGDDCPEKNDWYREAAKGDYEKLKEELNKDTREFHQSVRENRPLVTDEMLKGKVFEAQEVIPALVDEIGDMERAIECVFELAGEQLQPARFMTAEPKEEQNLDTKVPSTERSTERSTEQDITHQNKENMTQEEMKAAEAQEAQVAAQETAQEPVAEPAAEPAEDPAQEPAGEAQESAAEPAQEPAEEPSDEGAQAPAEEPAAEPAGEAAEEPTSEEETAAEPAEEETPAEEPAGEPAEEPAETETEPVSEEAVAAAEEDIDKMQETLHSAEQKIEEKDALIESLKEKVATMEGAIEERDAAKADFDKKAGEVEELNSQLSTLNSQLSERDKSIEEKDALIDQLKKQNAELKAEVKELSGKPAPMTDGAAGVPADNGTGEAPKGWQKRITRNMSYKEIRAAKKKAKEEAKK